MDAGDNGPEPDAPLGVGLGVEEDLGMHDTLPGGPLEVGHGEVVEVELGDQDGAALVVDVEERLQIAEDVGPADTPHVGVGQGDTVADGQFEQQLRLQRPLDVDVEFGLGKVAYERVHGGCGCRPGRAWGD